MENTVAYAPAGQSHIGWCEDGRNSCALLTSSLFCAFRTTNLANRIVQDLDGITDALIAT